MSDYVIDEKTDAFEVGRTDSHLIGSCAGCGEQFQAPNKGLGRAFMAAWKSRHAAHIPTPTQPRPTRPVVDDAGGA